MIPVRISRTIHTPAVSCLAARRRPRAGITLLDCLLASLVLAAAGGAVLCSLRETSRKASGLTRRLIGRQLAMDILDRQASGEARALLLTPVQGPALHFSHTLDEDERRDALAPEIAARFAPLQLRVDIELDAVAPPPEQPRVRYGWITCRVTWRDPIGGRQKIEMRTFTDAL